MTVTQTGFAFVFPPKLLGFPLCAQLEKRVVLSLDNLLVKVNHFSCRELEHKSFWGSVQDMCSTPHPTYLSTYLYLLRFSDDSYARAVKRVFLDIVLLFYEPSEELWFQLDAETCSAQLI